MINMDGDVLKYAESGHNILLTGFPGTGKSSCIEEIVENLSETKKVALTSTTGLSASLLRASNRSAVTIHKFCGLKDGRFESNELLDLLQNSESFEKYKRNICRCDVLVIDEISMLSLKQFEQIEFIFRHLKDASKPFGGCQVILSGDFYQLPPVPTIEYGDPGKSIVESQILNYFHHIHLTQVFRQKEVDLVQAIHEIARGELSLESQQLLQRMKRPLPPGERPVRLMARREDVFLWNAKCLREMPGQEKIYKSKDEGTISGIQSEREIHLKIGAPVILTANVNDTLVNGLQGIVQEMHDDFVKVSFPDIGAVEIRTFNFTKYDSKVKYDVGSRTQLPLKLSFAVTVHKCQGMTLERVVIDCKGMFEYGQLVVAVSRAVNKKGLQILNFANKLILRPPESITTFFSEERCTMYENDLSCCRNSCVKIQVKDRERNDDDDDGDDDDDDNNDDDGDDELMVEMMESLDQQDMVSAPLNLEDEIDSPLPAHLNIQDIVLTLTHQNPETGFQIKENEALKFLTSRPACVEFFMNYVWNKLKKSMSSSIGAVNVVTNKTMNAFFKSFQELATSENYKKLVCENLFPNTTLSDEHYNIAFRLATHLRKELLSEHTKPLKEKAEMDAQKSQGKQFSESDGGKGKIRYLGGWCLSSVRKQKVRRIMANVYNPRQNDLISAMTNEKELIDHLIAVSENNITQSSAFIETLSETSRRQNFRRGLTHITDAAFKFFIEFDIIVRSLQNNASINVYGKNIGKHLSERMLNSAHLYGMWQNLFADFEASTSAGSDVHERSLEEHLKQLYTDIVQKYLKMSVSQLRRDYLQELKVKKAEATRKQIKMRSQQRAKGEFSFKTIESDSTENKVASHKRLQSEIIADKNFLQKFTKAELDKLCKYYQFRTMQSKKDLVNKLGQFISDADGMKINVPEQPEAPKPKRQRKKKD